MTTDNQPVAPFVLGTVVWPGVAKLMEECGELMQVLGKILAFPEGEHPDGAGNLIHRLREETADVQAAILFLHSANGITNDFIRREQKVSQLNDWHNQGLNSSYGRVT